MAEYYYATHYNSGYGSVYRKIGVDRFSRYRNAERDCVRTFRIDNISRPLHQYDEISSIIIGDIVDTFGGALVFKVINKDILNMHIADDVLVKLRDDCVCVSDFRTYPSILKFEDYTKDKLLSLIDKLRYGPLRS